MGSAAGLGGSLVLWASVSNVGPVRLPVGGWGAPLGIELRADPLSVVMLTATAVVGSAVSLYATAYLEDTLPEALRLGSAGRGARFFAPLWLLLWSALNGIYLSADLFNLYVLVEILGLGAAALVTLAVTPRAAAAATRYLVVSLTGSIFFLLGIVLIYRGYGVLSLEALSGISPSGAIPAVALALMTVGLAMKTGLYPFHTWLPSAHACAPAPSSALLSALVVKGTFYILLRLWTDVFAVDSSGAFLVLGALGAVAILWGSVLALRQQSVKRLVAYSTVAQLGYLLLLFPLLASSAGTGNPDAWAGGVYHALSHAVAKAAMFLAAGSMSLVVGGDARGALAGVAFRRPMSFLAFGVAGLSLAGAPPSGGFVSKWLMLRSAAESNQWGWILIMGLGSFLTAAYVLQVVRSGLGHREGEVSFHEAASYRMEWVAMGLALLVVLMGVRPNEVLALIQAGVPSWGS